MESGGHGKAQRPIIRNKFGAATKGIMHWPGNVGIVGFEGFTNIHERGHGKAFVEEVAQERTAHKHGVVGG